MTLGLICSSRASDLYNFVDTEPPLLKTPITITITPKPPIHCSKALKNSILCGSISTLPNMVIPVPVNADILSKIPSINGIGVAIVKTSPPITPAHNHANEEMIIPCLRRIFFFATSSKNFIQNNPLKTEIAAGRTKLTISNSK